MLVNQVREAIPLALNIADSSFAASGATARARPKSNNPRGGYSLPRNRFWKNSFKCTRSRRSSAQTRSKNKTIKIGPVINLYFSKVLFSDLSYWLVNLGFVLG